MKKQDIDKLPKGVDQTFVDEINHEQETELRLRIVSLQIQNAENEAFKETEDYLMAADEYSQAKQRWQLVDGPVKDTTTAIKNKTKLVIQRLKDLGKI